MSDLVEVSSIDVSYVPRFRSPVVMVPVANEAVLYEEDTGRLHQLDPIATVVCHLIDGHTSVTDAVDELCSEFQAERSIVEPDVLELVRTLGRQGLLVDVEAEVETEEVADAC